MLKNMINPPDVSGGKKAIALFAFLLFASSLFAVYQVGDIVDDFSWTDNTGAPHSIYELINAEKAVVFFWGGYG